MYTSTYALPERTLSITTRSRAISEHLRTTYRRLESLPQCRAPLDVAELQTGAGQAITFNGLRLRLHGPHDWEQHPADVAFYGGSHAFRATLKAHRDWAWCYAAGVRFGDRAVMIAGPSGSGKTTLALALLRLGATFYGDETVLWNRPTNRIAGFPRSLLVREGTLALVGDSRLTAACKAASARAGLRGAVWDNIDAGEVFGSGIFAAPATLSTLIVLDPHAGAQVQRLRPTAAALRLRPHVGGYENSLDVVFCIARDLATTEIFALGPDSVQRRAERVLDLCA